MTNIVHEATYSAVLEQLFRISPTLAPFSKFPQSLPFSTSHFEGRSQFFSARSDDLRPSILCTISDLENGPKLRHGMYDDRVEFQLLYLCFGGECVLEVH
jgi:hypothetical protein